MQKLYETYENCSDIAGLETHEGKVVLLPIAHTLLRAHITVALDAQGNLLDAVVQEDVMGTVAPCTEASESRSGTNPPPHPLFDKLQYLAGDYDAYTDEKGQGAGRFYGAYLRQLGEWCSSKNSHPKVEAVFRYVQKGSLIEDLVSRRVLHTDDHGVLLDKWLEDRRTAPPIFQIKNCTPRDAIVRFTVDIPGDPEDRLWMDTSLRESAIAYVLSQQSKTALCYVSGKTVPLLEKHPKKIVNTRANAKLVSANDSSGFTYRGRFIVPGQALSLGYETSVKTHNALRWLVDTRGLRCDTQVIIAWGTRNEAVPHPISDSDELFGESVSLTSSDLWLDADVRSQRAYAKQLTAALLGLRHNLDAHSDVVVMALDSATDGRLSITYYRELKSNEYLERVAKWHSTCIWLHDYKRDSSNRRYTFVGAPSSRDIAIAAYGVNASDKLKKSTIERLLPCIFDGATVPSDLVNSAVRRASNPVAIESWEWNKALSIACALYRKQHESEGYTLALDENRTDRSYLFGRLLAVADHIEAWALKDSGEHRETNAMRYMNAFSQRPLKTWMLITRNLRPYQARLKGRASTLNDLITQITDKFEHGDFEPQNDRSLNGLYLLGFHNQRKALLDHLEESGRRRVATRLEDDK